MRGEGETIRFGTYGGVALLSEYFPGIGYIFAAVKGK